MDDKSKLAIVVSGVVVGYMLFSEKGRKCLQEIIRKCQKKFENFTFSTEVNDSPAEYLAGLLIPANHWELIEEIKETWNREKEISMEQAEGLRRSIWKIWYGITDDPDYPKLRDLSLLTEDSKTPASSFFLMLFYLQEENYDFAQGSLARNHDGILGLCNKNIVRNIVISPQLSLDSFAGIKMKEV
jgi:hypothetical protein